MEIRLLGLVEASLDGRPIPLGGGKPRALLAMLALHVNEPVSVDRLIEALWGERPPASAPKLVQLYVSHLRRELASADAEIVTRGRGYELRMAADSVDAVRFERLVEEASRADASPDGLAHEALALWRGPPLGDLVDEPFAAAEIRRLEELWLRARELDVDAALAAGDHRRVVAELDQLVTEHPLRERLHAQRMLALYRCGRQAEALEAYRHARRVLVEEVGVEPGPELRRLHEAILNQDPALDRPPAAARPALRRSPRHLAAIALAAGCAAAALAVLAIVLLAGRGGLDRVDGDSVAAIDAGDGRITAQYSVGHSPGVAVTGAGSVWVANRGDGTISRIDAVGRQVTTLDVGGEPTGMAFGGGLLWVADGEDRTLDEVDPGSNRVVRRLRVGNAPRGVTTTPGAVWVASPVDGDVQRIALDDGSRRRISVGGGPVALAAGAGAVWALSEEAGVVRRLDPRSGTPRATIGVGHGPAAVAAGAGAIWVASRDDGTVSRIDPATDAVSDVVRVGGNPVALTVGDGGVWAGDERGGTVVRIDPGSRRVTRRITLGASPSGLAVARGSVWATALPARASHRGGTLRVEAPAFDTCNCVDPARYDGANVSLLSTVYDGLVAYRRVRGAAGSELVGDLATTVPEPANGGRTYVFQLRRGILFSNGAPVRPIDFRASIERMLRLGAGGVPPIYAGIVGAGGCVPSRCDLSRGIEIDAAARTITIHLRHPDFELPDKLALPLSYVVPAGSPLRFARNRPLPGTGPYRIARLETRRVELVRNPHFRSWSLAARPDGFPDRIVLSLSPHSRAQVAAVRAGRADVLAVAGVTSGGVPVRDVRALALDDPGRLHSAPAAVIDYVFLNVREPPFDDVRVRRAFEYAVDRRHAVALVGGTEVASPTCQVIPPGLPGYVPACRYARDPAGSRPELARARRLVAASGTRGRRVRVWVFRGRFQPAAAYAAAVLRTIGYRASVKLIPAVPDYFAAISDPRSHAQAGVVAWIADFLSPSNFVGPMFACLPARLGANFSRYCDPALDAAAQRTEAASVAATNRRWAAIDRRIMRAAPIVPLDNARSVLYVSPRVGNVQQHLQLGPLLDQMWVR
jgi:peptide/nickel transport system substrate-binding protein